ncbi:MAG TPA: DUF2948 family protein [Rhizobiaceae bacterium]|nr:DUF2948 family protein [Rhizobiaceae bacterium]
MVPLKLAALDADDLAVISAHVQDAVMKVEDMRYMARERRFILAMNRFAWETAGAGAKRRPYERRRAVLSFARVFDVKSTGIHRSDRDRVYSLLAVRFEETEAPAGIVELVFAGEAALRLEVECIEAQLDDLGSAWETRHMPRHGGA